MANPVAEPGTSLPGNYRPTRREMWRVVVLQVFFFLTALWGLDAPFVSMHFVRQNQTFDMAQHVFHDGWLSVVMPRTSFSQLSEPDYIFSPIVTPNPRFTIVHLEVPFHGIIGWPAAMLFPNHERAIVRLVSVIFALFSIRIFYRIVRYWLEPASAFVGTLLWTTAPLIIHFGQAPTPDILATTGMAAAFLFASRGQLLPSSAAFLFTVLAKLSIIIYGLPILVALLLAKECRSIAQAIGISLAWGAAPLLGLVAWVSLSLHDPPGSWVVFGGYHPGEYGRVAIKDLIHPSFYGYPVLYVFVFGCGVLGTLGLLCAAMSRPGRMNLWLKASIIGALVSNYIFERIVWREPQYTLPVLFWVIVAASFGFPFLLEKVRADKRWRTAMAGIVLLHILVAIGTILFLKAPRVGNLPDMQAAARLTPPDARIVVYAATPSASPSVWLERNTLKLNPISDPGPPELGTLTQQLDSFQKAGFDYLMVFDMEAQHQHHLRSAAQGVTYVTNYAGPNSPLCRFFDARYRKIFSGDHVVLYSLSPGVQNH